MKTNIIPVLLSYLLIYFFGCMVALNWNPIEWPLLLQAFTALITIVTSLLWFLCLVVLPWITFDQGRDEQ